MSMIVIVKYCSSLVQALLQKSTKIYTICKSSHYNSTDNQKMRNHGMILFAIFVMRLNFKSIPQLLYK